MFWNRFVMAAQRPLLQPQERPSRCAALTVASGNSDIRTKGQLGLRPGSRKRHSAHNHINRHSKSVRRTAELSGPASGYNTSVARWIFYGILASFNYLRPDCCRSATVQGYLSMPPIGNVLNTIGM